MNGVVIPELDERDPALWSQSAERAVRQARAPYRGLAAALVMISVALLVGVVGSVSLACAVSPALRVRLFPRDLARRRPWVASSADPGYASSGNGPSSSGPLFFHTTSSDHPWLEIDLGAEHLIRSVLVKNRADCCQKRALPLNVEILDGQSWKLIGSAAFPLHGLGIRCRTGARKTGAAAACRRGDAPPRARLDLRPVTALTSALRG